jgi:hypothetical protein
MARNQSRDPLVLDPHWHIDCRLPAELPDDRVVSSRFLVNLPFGLATLALLVLFGWELSNDLSLRSNIADWGRRLADSRKEVSAIKQQQREYTVLAFNIETVSSLMKNRLYVSHFMKQLSRARPPQMVIESVDSTDSSVIVRGGISGTAEQAAEAIGNYMDELRKDPQIGPRFDSILVSSFERPMGADRQNFELTFRFKGDPAS